MTWYVYILTSLSTNPTTPQRLTPQPQPPKKRGGSSSATASKRPKARQSKLAKENDVSGEEENEIKEVFHLFSIPHEDFPDEKEGVIPREDVRKALVYDMIHPLALPVPVPLGKSNTC